MQDEAGLLSHPRVTHCDQVLKSVSCVCMCSLEFKAKVVQLNPI